MAYWITTYPLDVIKTQIQVMAKNTGGNFDSLLWPLIVVAMNVCLDRCIESFSTQIQRYVMFCFLKY